jgi:hypothetical protein
MQKGSPLGWASHTVREFSAGLEKQFDVDGSSLAVPITPMGVISRDQHMVAGIEITLTVSVDVELLLGQWIRPPSMRNMTSGFCYYAVEQTYGSPPRHG